jgi:hypothetical protein
MARRNEEKTREPLDAVQPIATPEADASIERLVSRAHSAAVDAGPVAAVGCIVRKRYMKVHLSTGVVYYFLPSQIGMTAEKLMELADEQVLRRCIDELSERMYYTYAEFAAVIPMGNA